MAENYLDMLKQEFLDRKERRPQYSERAFARDLGLSSGFVSLLFNGKRGISPRTCLKVIKNLNWSELKSQKFINSVQSAQFLETKKTKKIEKLVDEQELEIDHFRLISNIYHFTVLEFIQTREVKSIECIMDYFQIERIECEMIIKRLERLGMIERKGERGYVSSQKNTRLGATPSEAVRNYHKQAIGMSLDAIEEQSFEKRELKALTFSIAPKKIRQAKATIDKFVKDFNSKYGNQKNGSIYQLNIQLFGHGKVEGDKK